MQIYNLAKELVEVQANKIKGVKDAAQRYNNTDLSKWQFRLYLDVENETLHTEEIYGFNSWNKHNNPNYIYIPLLEVPEGCQRQQESQYKGSLDKRRTVSWFKYCLSQTLAALKYSLEDYRQLCFEARYNYR